MKFSSIDILGYPVFNGVLSDVVYNSKILINTFSPNSYGIALKDKRFETSLKKSDILTLDGMGIAIGSLILHGRNIKKIAGQDCFDYLMAQANKNFWKVFFLGSTTATLEKITKRASLEYSNIKIGSYSPPYKAQFSKEEDILMIQAINAFKPNLLFIGLTAPKQEKWAYEHKHLVNVNIISTIGNVFDWYAGNSQRPAKIWIKLRLEWLVRIFLRPEIFRRNFKNQMLFFRDVFLHMLFIKRIK